MSSKPIQPLFTTSPLILPSSNNINNNHHQTLFVTSPISSSPPIEEQEEELEMEEEEEEVEEYRKHRTYSSSHPSSAFPSIPPSPVFETLSFAKIPIPTASSTNVSTDSEAFSSDWAPPPGPSYSNTNSRSNSQGQGLDSKRSSIQSPSLISCLFQSTSIVSSNINSNNRKTCHSPTFTKNDQCSKPILRRGTTSTSASEDNRDNQYQQQRPQSRSNSNGFGLGINKITLEPDSKQNEGNAAPTAPVLKKRPSVLTFAVSSNSHSNASRAGPSQSRSTSVSPTSSYARLPRSPCARPNWGKVRGQLERESQQEIEEENDDEDGDGDEEDDEDYMVESPLPIPGHGESDEEDQGYVEDEEDGFTTDGDEDDVEGNRNTDNVFGNVNMMGRTHNNVRSKTTWNEGQIQWNKEYTNNTPKRRSSTIPSTAANNHYMTSTDDNSIYPQGVELRGRKTSICINENTKPSSSRCTRHRSPPPPVRSQSYISAPPAARSPSAADLCRRRGSGQESSTTGLMETMSNSKNTKGWRSDDSAFFPNRPPISKTNSFKLPSASASIISESQIQSQRKKSLPTPKLESTARSNSHTRSILKSSQPQIDTQPEPEPASIPMMRSSGENKIPPKTPPLDNHTIPTSVNLLRRGSAPVKQQNDLLDINDNPPLDKPQCLARSAIGYEEEEMNIAHHGHYHRDRGIRII